MSTVLATFAILKDHVKLKVVQDVARIDNIVFRLHYRATFLILLAATLLVSSRQFIGEHIRCISDTEVAKGFIDVVNTFCFFTSTFTVAKHMNYTAVELGHVAHPGVGPVTKQDEVVHHAYYQWVPFVLFFQALSFYMPHYLWRKWEGGRLKMLVSGLHMASISLQEERLKTDNGITVPSIKDREEAIAQIRQAFINRIHLNRNWAYYLSFCEILNFLNVLAQIYITDAFLGGAFLGLGNTLRAEDFRDQMDPLDIIFPKVTKCTFYKYGPSGSIQSHDALCVMALNVVNEKIYTFLWFWFIILAIVTGLGLLWRILTMVVHSRSTKFNRWVFGMACPGKYNPWNVLRVTHEYYYSDWLFLYYIAKNLDGYVFKELLLRLAEDLRMENKAMGFRSVDEEDLLNFEKSIDKEP
ncbi:innexin inx7 [Prorops nasuta]|uniref:innexin inx7 n=1 Tax=Prorops nasuta TaxID=863751 RepID=UPI0034CD3953